MCSGSSRAPTFIRDRWINLPKKKSRNIMVKRGFEVQGEDQNGELLGCRERS
jgi:hypothetical protein